MLDVDTEVSATVEALEAAGALEAGAEGAADPEDEPAHVPPVLSETCTHLAWSGAGSV